MKRILPILFILTITLVACNNTPNSKVKEIPNSAPTVNNQTTPAQTGPVVLPDAYLPSIPLEDLIDMYKICNQMDYIFYELPISSSVNDIQSAQAHLKHISDTPVSIKEKERCEKAIGRIFFKSDGEDLIQADAYFGGGCAFFIFYKEGKATYSNVMTPAGVNHFNQVIAAATGKTTPGQ